MPEKIVVISSMQLGIDFVFFGNSVIIVNIICTLFSNIRF
jgi:hypothetical protein